MKVQYVLSQESWDKIFGAMEDAKKLGAEHPHALLSLLNYIEAELCREEE